MSTASASSAAIQAEAPAVASSRLYALDVVRGVAIAGVVLFHLVWDLDFTGFLPPGIASHWLWIAFGRTLAGSFMFLVGVSLVLAHGRGIRWKSFARRTAVIALAAIAITVATYQIFPAAFVFYGILHAIVIASVVGLLVLRWPVWAVVAVAILIWALPFFYSSSLFDTRWLAWTGFAQTPPASNDLVPVFPWLGITFVGIFIARIGRRYGWERFLGTKPRTTAAGRFMVWLGRHSLIIYLLHQPVLLAIIIPAANWTA